MEWFVLAQELLIDSIDFVNYILWSYVLVAGLIGVGIYFSLKTGMVQIRSLVDVFKVMKPHKAEGIEEENVVSPLQSLFLATAVRAGTGNIAGVAIAISLGGPGAVFWMWLMAVIGGASSFIESILGQIYQSRDDHGGYKGGPSYYMAKGLNKRWMGILFALFVVFCYGFAFNSVQSNTILAALELEIPAIGEDIDTKYIIALLLSVFFGVIIFGGVKSVTLASGYMVPVMAIIYIGMGMLVVLLNLDRFTDMFGLIVSEAFNFKAGLSGFFVGLLQGIKRGLFSNEAGMGSGAIAAAAAHVSHPVKQGFVQTFGVYIDTLVICSTTAFLVLITDAYKHPNYEGIQIVQYALDNQVGDYGSIILTVSIFLFAFTSMIGNYYYGESSLSFIFHKARKKAVFIYRIMTVVIVFIGAIAQLKLVWNFADLTMGLLALINIVAIILLGKVALLAYQDYKKQRLDNTDPHLFLNSIPVKIESECWPENE